ncbi:BnaC02g48190D [Brassica napus]|uniref:BnaC02g48190D protein n=1 Tax=Brassica napus TaxID=3708 RepID=A0A078J6M7_BRANA|nr:BnaC02g48190D [Brassica napus]
MFWNDHPSQNLVSYEMTLLSNMLCLLVKNRVLAQIYRRHTVTVKSNTSMTLVQSFFQSDLDGENFSELPKELKPPQNIL